MSTPATGSVGISAALVLGVWEAVSSERSVQRVLESAADAILPLVPLDAVSLFSFDASSAKWLYVVGLPSRDDETPSEYFERPEFSRRVTVPARPLIAYDHHAVWKDAYTCGDLLARDVWFEHEAALASAGVRAYAWMPLLFRKEPLGAVIFARSTPVAFSLAQVALLTAVSRPLATAAANALANDEIKRLREEVEAENLELKAQLGKAPWFGEIVGESQAMRRVLARVEQVATTDATVLITGETGTGKELIARAIHRRSRRATGPLVKVNCAAIPDSLLASELFGHERGAFTGATERRRGRFEQADGGTIFLDEIGDLPPATQVHLLRVLQEREVERLGGTRPVRIDVRIVAATNRDLAADVREGRFRSDLYYRMNAFPVHVPPLRERPEDVPPLVAHLAAKYATRLGRPIERIDARGLRTLAAQRWAGNIRELENVVERAVILSRGGTLKIDRDVLPAAGDGSALSEQLDTSERAAIEAALAVSRGRVSGARGAARQLGMPASTLEFRIRRLGIDKFRHR